MNYRWFIWGLSNGVFVLAIAGGFWFGMAQSSLRVPWPLAALTVACEAGLLWGAYRLRRKAGGFRLAEVKQGDEHQRRILRTVFSTYRWITLAQTVVVALGVGLCAAFHRIDLIWSVIGLIVSLHFAPLARVFRVPPYYATAVLGSILSLLSFAAPRTPMKLVFLGNGLGAVVWLTAIYALLRADRLAQRAIELFGAA